MPIKINCIHNDDGAWCFNKNVPRAKFLIIPVIGVISLLIAMAYARLQEDFMF